MLACNPTPGYRRLMRLQGKRAAALLRRAERILPSLPLGAALVVSVITELHWEWIRELEARGWDNTSGPRVRVSTVGKVQLTAGTIWRTLVSSARSRSKATVAGP